MSTDEELIEEIQAGSEAAMEVLVRRHYNQVYSYLYRRTGDKQLSGDLTQEVFVKMMNGLSRYANTGSGSFTAWLFTIAINRCRDYYRSSEFRQQAATYEFTEEIASKDERSSVPSIFDKKEKRKEIREAILSLPETQCEAIVLKYYHDMKIRDIAVLTETGESTVKSRLRQGLAKLKSALQRRDFLDERQRQ
ncbi:RNA polymerase sigma factor [Paenibacillus sp. J5C2022]|uniref:RNA polymerase sigma factor n=1 Tax=Paenibacillus sp. J5C2022 TaxID=2977129 RepID=UPI0021CDF911|nr:sigma-70 family RNA polymerase sigma factor [Paenibacillus sp. J5C2022]